MFSSSENSSDQGICVESRGAVDLTLPKILIISSLGAPPYLGGIENVIDTLLKSSLSESYSFSIFDTYRKPDPKRTFWAKVTFALRLPFICAMNIYRKKPQIAHIHFCSKTDFWKHSLCLFACRVMNIHTILHLHGGSFDTVYEQYSSFQKAAVQFILRRTDILVALSEYWKIFLCKLTGQVNVFIAPNPINCKQLYSFNNHDNPKKHSVVLLGCIGKRKGHFDVLKAVPEVLAKNPQTHFYFAGQDEESGATEKLSKIAQENGTISNVHFLGGVTGEAKLKLLGEAGIVILPSYAENMPISVLEGMASGKPVISTKVGAIPEVIIDNVSGLLIDAGDWKNLANKINYLFENEEIAKQMGKNAHLRAKANWDIDSISLVYDDMYRMLLSKKKKSLRNLADL